MSNFLCRLTIALALSFGTFTLGVVAEDPVNDRETYPKPKATSPDEPKIAKFSIERAVDYLDNALMTWLRERKCASCHTDYPHLLARTVLDANAPVRRIPRRYLEERTEAWDEE